MGKKEKGPVLWKVFWIFQKEKPAEGKRFWRDFGEKEKHIKICVELKGIFLILQNWFEPI